MQTRIKIVESENVEKKFYPEWSEVEGFWHPFHEYVFTYISNKIPVCRNSLEEAQTYIDNQLGLEVKSTTYVKYP